MLNLLTLQLEAVLEEKNLFRKYDIYIGKDLFGTWVLTTANGRIGTLGKLRSYSFSSKEHLQEKLDRLLKKRQKAKKRIGIDYKIVSYSCAENLLKENFFTFLKLSSYLKT